MLGVCNFWGLSSPKITNNVISLVSGFTNFLYYNFSWPKCLIELNSSIEAIDFNSDWAKNDFVTISPNFESDITMLFSLICSWCTLSLAPENIRSDFFKGKRKGASGTNRLTNQLNYRFEDCLKTAINSNI